MSRHRRNSRRFFPLFGTPVTADATANTPVEPDTVSFHYPDGSWLPPMRIVDGMVVVFKPHRLRAGESVSSRTVLAFAVPRPRRAGSE